VKVTFLLTSTSHTRPLSIRDSAGFSRDRTDVLLGSTGLERRLASLKVASVVLRTDEGEDDEVDGNDSDEDTLNEGVVGNILWASRCLNRRTRVFTTSYKEG